jgi:hypothetical protein
MTAKALLDYNSAGTYTPTNTSITNLDATPTAYLTNYMRVGDMVTVSGKFTVDPTGGGDIVWEMTLPVASTFTAEEDLCGTFQLVTSSSNVSEGIKANTSNNKARFLNNAGFTSSVDGFFILMYRVK